MNWLSEQAKSISTQARDAALQRQLQLTKPAGSLGRIEEIAILLAGLQGRADPCIERTAIRIFAADHGVVAEGVSAYPQEVTGQMIMNFLSGGAAISVLAKEIGADFQVVNMGVITEVPEHERLQSWHTGAGTKNFCIEAAMDEEQLQQALTAGKSVVEELVGIDLFIGGEMGIGNTTSAAALACALLALPPERITGRGTGVDDAGLGRKINVIRRALQRHGEALSVPLSCLQRLGGFEIAALTGGYIRCAQLGIPVLVDGFICSAAALVAVKLNASVRPWLIFSHRSAESGHGILLEALDAETLLSLNMRLGEGSGAAIAVPLLRAACLLHNGMATFAEAAVSDRETN